MGTYIELFLRFWLRNNELIIQWIILTLTFLLLYWLIFLGWRSKESSLGEEVNSSGSVIRDQFPIYHSEGALNAVEEASFDGLKRELHFKNHQIDKLKRELETNFKLSDRKVGIERVEFLEKKLAEYKIIAGDIAQMSEYKKEIEELRNKLDGFSRKIS